MAKRKNKKKSGIFAKIGAFIIILAVGLAAADYLDIFTLSDWKEFFGSETVSVAGGEAEVHYINVGQGDCSLVLSEGKSLLIDTGEKEYAQTVCDYLDQHDVNTIDYMLLTHPHSDHMGGASYIIDNTDVKNIIIPKLPDDMTPDTKFYEQFLESVQDKGLKLTAAKPGEVYEIGECSLEILSPVKDDYSDLNNFSAAAMLTHGQNNFLFTGDIEKKAEKDIIESGRLKSADVLKVAHHGSNTSSSEDFLDIVDPDYAVIMCGDNSYKHPHEDTVERLKEYTDKIYRTDMDGTVVFTSSKDGLAAETENQEN
ncbi:ComEC/Rec2 family competence protein [Porcipelethomonas sp.]|uniref:ComEC/Rec2 family competence protein n=1 Tax=Porcipelethomonas sp. TaxID=2981675 RepID=UPI003EF1CFC0